MKKMFLMLAIIVSAISVSAQKKSTSSIVVKSGVAVSNNVDIESLEVGKSFGKNTLTVIGLTSDKKGQKRGWATGVRYLRTVASADAFYLKTGAEVSMNLTGSVRSLTFSPGAFVGVKLNKHFAVEVGTSTPIAEGVKLFDPIRFQSGVQLVVSL